MHHPKADNRTALGSWSLAPNNLPSPDHTAAQPSHDLREKQARSYPNKQHHGRLLAVGFMLPAPHNKNPSHESNTYATSH
jgi:hypothetical protein